MTGYEVTCTCGKVHLVSEDAAGSLTVCSCGATLCGPSPAELQTPGIENLVPAQVPDRPTSEESAPGPNPVAEIIGPEPVILRAGVGVRWSPVAAALTADSIWIQDTWRLRSVPLRD